MTQPSSRRLVTEANLSDLVDDALAPVTPSLYAARDEAVAAEAAAETAAGTATTKAGEAATSAGSALASKNDATDSKNSAATSASTAATKGGEANTSAISALASRIAAALSETAAAGSATSALGSKNAAETAAAAAAAQAALLASIPQALATAQGYWVVVQDAPPVAGTQYGVPLLWIDRTTALVPVPVNPPVPTWNDALSQFTVPQGITGIDYVWTSGGGGIGATATPGSVVSTSGAFPRTVVITPTAKPGYVLATPGQVYAHSFPDPVNVTILTSETFTGQATSADVVGTNTDAALGGVAFPWKNHIDGLTRIGLQCWEVTAGDELHSSAWTANAAERSIRLSFPGVHNIRAEFDVTAFDPAGGNVYTFLPQVGSFSAYIGGTQHGRIITPDGNHSELLPGISGPLPAMATGHWVFQQYEKTLRIVHPNGTEVSYTYTAATAPPTSQSFLLIRSEQNVTSSVTIDNLKISKMGF